MTHDTPLDTNSSTDRLSFTVFLACAIHGLLIFGLSFKSSKPSESAPSVTVTLATHTSIKAPENADFIAQTNQLGSGTESQSKVMTTDITPPRFNSQFIRDTMINRQRKSTMATPHENHILTSTQTDNTVHPLKPSDNAQEKPSGNDTTDIDPVNLQIASLKARLSVQRQNLAKIPRERILTSVSALASSEAAYLNQWTQKIELIGNRHFPAEAIRKKLTGKLRLEVVIHHDGHIVAVNLKQSSGQKLFDTAAIQIVQQASPFQPFPSDIRKDYEHLVIIRTWHFSISGLATSQ